MDPQPAATGRNPDLNPSNVSALLDRPILRPRLVFRIGFAGSQELGSDTENVELTIREIFGVVAQRLTWTIPKQSHNAGGPGASVTHFYSTEPPLLRLVTGLCEGADTLAAETFTNMPRSLKDSPRLEHELAAVIPFDLATYRSSRPVRHQATFDRHVSQCAYIFEADGIYDPPTVATPDSDSRSARAYRGQSMLLLRHSDLVVAVSDPDSHGRGGGTLETVRAALAFGLPVVFVHSRTAKVTLIAPGDDAVVAYGASAGDTPSWQTQLSSWVHHVVAGPEATPGEDSDEGTQRNELLAEFFDTSSGSGASDTHYGATLWQWLTYRCEPRGKKAENNQELVPYETWRARATILNERYTALYRGTFFSNFIRAALAVALAAASLVIVGMDDHSPSSGPLEVEHQVGLGSVTEAPSPTARHDTPHPRATSRLQLALLCIGVLKLYILISIFRSTRQGKKHDWGEKAVDYRYLVERLRAMFYLPLAGSFQPPAAAPPQYATRAVRQSAVDWLFDAIVRSISPAVVLNARHHRVLCNGTQFDVTLLAPNPRATLEAVRDDWIEQQITYHEHNAITMEHLHRFLERWVQFFTGSVIAVVAIDIAIVICVIFEIGPRDLRHSFHLATPYLMFAAALFPAIVASLNGIAEQSECRRLAERSIVLRNLLRGRSGESPAKGSLRVRIASWVNSMFLFCKPPAVAQQEKHLRGGKWAQAQLLAERLGAHSPGSPGDPGSWTPEVLRLTESVAELFVQEVAEWSVLYGKEIPEV